MKKNYFVICFVALFVLITSSITPTHGSQEAASNYRLIVSFISFASGIDHRVKKEIDEFILNYEKEKGLRLSKEMVRWGREGEVDYCFKLTEISEDDQEGFISEINSLAKKSKQVQVRQNAPCRNKR